MDESCGLVAVSAARKGFDGTVAVVALPTDSVGPSRATGHCCRFIDVAEVQQEAWGLGNVLSVPAPTRSLLSASMSALRLGVSSARVRCAASLATKSSRLWRVGVHADIGTTSVDTSVDEWVGCAA